MVSFVEEMERRTKRQERINRAFHRIFFFLLMVLAFLVGWSWR